MTRKSDVAYRLALYAALVAMTGTLGWVLFHAGMTTSVVA